MRIKHFITFVMISLSSFGIALAATEDEVKDAFEQVKALIGDKVSQVELKIERGVGGTSSNWYHDPNSTAGRINIDMNDFDALSFDEAVLIVGHEFGHKFINEGTPHSIELGCDSYGLALLRNLGRSYQQLMDAIDLWLLPYWTFPPTETHPGSLDRYHNLEQQV